MKRDETKLDQVVPKGREAFADLIEQIRATDGPTEAVAEQLWPQFKDAVAGVLAELGEEHSAGLRAWQEVRRGGAGARADGKVR